MRIEALGWEEWREQFEVHHERMRQTVPGFEGYGPRPIMATTGESAWMEYWGDGYSPEDALAEDMTYWDD